jgi:hypothetical protein
VTSTCLERTRGPVNRPPKPTCGSNTWLVKFQDTFRGYIINLGLPCSESTRARLGAFPWENDNKDQEMGRRFGRLKRLVRQQRGKL